MKHAKYIIGLSILLAGLFTVVDIRTQAQGNSVRQPAATVIVGYSMSYRYDPERQHNVENGLVVGSVTRSSTAPEIEVGANIAEVMAGLEDLGFQLLPQTQRTELIFNRPPR